MDFGYALSPLVAWLMAGTTKFVVNSVKSRQLAFGQIGYGGLPSNHSAIVTSVAAIIAIREGVAHPAFGVAAALAFVVILDAGSLRRQLGRHAVAINQIQPQEMPLRERMGHTKVEIVAGIAVGIVAGWLTDLGTRLLV